MKFLLSALIVFVLLCCEVKLVEHESGDVAQDQAGPPASVMLTAYSTTLLADGKDNTKLRIALVDSLSREVPNRGDSVRVYVTGDGRVSASDGSDLPVRTDTIGSYVTGRLNDGTLYLKFVSGDTPDKVKVEARSGSLWPGGHEIHTIDRKFQYLKPSPDQLPATTKPIDRMIGADISWLPQFEDRGRKYFEDSTAVDGVELLRDHGFNYIRLRIFVNPESENGYAPGKGYCGLDSTLSMARRVHAAGMKILLNFHYSDYWADPQQQNKPERWADLNFETLCDSVQAYTTHVIRAFAEQGTPPDMVQVGNEINHGMLWPDGHIGNPENLAALLRAGIAGTKDADPVVPIMLHVALGGQNSESVFWFDNMLARDVEFDIIGLSYYPRWHGTLPDLKSNMLDLIERYHKPVNVVEYSDFKKEVHDLVFGLPDEMGKGACIWEPLSDRSHLFDAAWHVTELMQVYDTLHAVYLAD